MKSRKSMIVILICTLLCTVAGWLLCENRILKQKSDYPERKFGITEIQFLNLEQKENEYLAGDDPQMILTELGEYVETIRLDGLYTQEEVQIFYTEQKEELFS